MAVSVSMRSLAPAPPAVSLRPAPASTTTPNNQPRSQPAIRPLAVAPSPAPAIQPNFASSSSSSSASSSSSSAVSSASTSPPPPPLTQQQQQQNERRQTLTKGSVAPDPSPRAVRSASISSSSSSALFPSAGTPTKANEEEMMSTTHAENNGGSNNNRAKIQPSKSWVLPARAKPGRKPSEEEPPTKRKAQNRASQRAFRERKQSYLSSLEEKVAEHERRQTEGSVELQKVAKRFKEENEALQKQMEAMRRAHEEATLRWEEERKRYRMQQRDLEARLAMALQQGQPQTQSHHQQQQQQQRSGSISSNGYGSREMNANGNGSTQYRERVPSSGHCGSSSRRTTETAAPTGGSVVEKNASSRRASFVPASPTKDLGLGVTEPFRIDRDCGFCTDQSPCLCSGEAVLDFAGDDNDFNGVSDGTQTTPSSHVSIKLEQDNDDFHKQQQKQPSTPTSTKPLGESIFAMRRRSSVTNSSNHISNGNNATPSQKLWYTIPAQPQSHLSRKEAVQVCPTFTMTDRTPWHSAQQQPRSTQMMTQTSSSAVGAAPLGLRGPQVQQQHQLTRSGKPKIWSTIPLASPSNAPASSLPSPVFRLGQQPAKTTNDGQVGTHRPRSDSISSVASEAACTGNPADCDACRTDPVLAAFCEAVSSHLRHNDEEEDDDDVEEDGSVVDGGGSINNRGKRVRNDGEEEPQRTKRTKWTGPAILEVGNAVPLPLKNRGAVPLASSSSQSYAAQLAPPRGCLRPSATEATSSASGKLWHFTPANEASTIDQTHAARPVLPHASLSAPTVAGSASYYSNTYQLHQHQQQHQHQQHHTQQDANGMRRTSSSSSSPSVALPTRPRHPPAEGNGSSAQELNRRHGASLSIPRAFQQIRSHPSFQQWWYRQQRLASADAPHPTALLPHGSQPSPPPPPPSSSQQQQQQMMASDRRAPHYNHHHRHHNSHLHDASPGGLELLADVVSRRSPRLRSRELHGSRSASRSAIRSAAHSPMHSEARDATSGENGGERVLVPIETLEAAAARSGQSSATASPRGTSEERQVGSRKRDRDEGRGDGNAVEGREDYEGEERRRTRRKLLFVESRAVEDALALLDSQQDREEEEEEEGPNEGEHERVKGKPCYCAGEGGEEKSRSSSSP